MKTTFQQFFFVVASAAAAFLHLEESPLALSVYNEHIRLDLVLLPGPVPTVIQRISSQGTLVFSSLNKRDTLRSAASPLYSFTDNAAIDDRRVLIADCFTQFQVLVNTSDSITVQLNGTGTSCPGLSSVVQTMSLTAVDDYIRNEVALTLAEAMDSTLEYALSSYIFEPCNVTTTDPTCPAFVHMPCVKNGQPGGVCGDKIFNSPQIILEHAAGSGSLIPRVDLLNSKRVEAPGARPMSSRHNFAIKQGTPSFPTLVDVEKASGITNKTVLSYGYGDVLNVPHVYWVHTAAGTMQRKLSANNLTYGFDLFAAGPAGTSSKEYRMYQRASEYAWDTSGSPALQEAQQQPQYMPLLDMAQTIYPASSAFTGDGGNNDTAGWQEWEIDGVSVGGFHSPAGQWYTQYLNNEWFNDVHLAVGMFLWSQQDPVLADLKRRARLIINRTLAAPQNAQGLFPSSAVHTPGSSTTTWIRSWRKIPRPYDPTTTGQFWDFNSDWFNLGASSKTAAWLLEYYMRCEQDSRILYYLKPYADFLVQLSTTNKGQIPLWLDAQLAPIKWMQFNTDSAASAWFLANFAELGEGAEYLDAAMEIGNFFIDEVLPEQKWSDIETFYSCSIKPEAFYDESSGQWPRNTLSMKFAISAGLALFRATHDPGWLHKLAVPTADYAALYQATWNPRLMSPETTYGGLGGWRSQNSDAEWMDMRQTIFSFDFVELGKELKRQDYLERGVAAMRAGLALITHPLSMANGVFPHPNQPGKNYYGIGVGPENVDHEGLPQLPLRSGPDWGETGGLTAAALILESIGGVYIDLSDLSEPVTIGVDGVLVSSVKASNTSATTMTLMLQITSQIGQLAVPWTESFNVDVVVVGMPASILSVDTVINDSPPVSLTPAQLVRYPITI